MFRRKGTIVSGHYSGGEWCESVTCIDADGATIEKVAEQVAILTKEYYCAGSAIDFGFVSNTSSVAWHKDIYKVEIKGGSIVETKVGRFKR